MNLFHEAKKVLDKDGKVNALGPYGKQKLTGREIQTYFRRNKVKDKVVKKAVEVALDLGGAMDIAIKAIKDYYGNKILKAKEVQTALKFANEESFRDSFDMLDEDYKKVIKMYPRDRDWKKLITKHKRAIDALRNNEKDLPKKVEDELLTWASQTGEVGSKDDAEDFIMSIIDEETVSENYRTAARHGMGTEGKKEARVGLELDYYDKEGVKHMGKIVKKDSKGYTVKDDKTGKMHTFVYHDRIKARKFLQKMGDNLKEETLTEGTWEVPDSYPKLVKLNKFLSQKANFKDAQSVHRWHVQADAYFGDDAFSDDIDAYKTTLKGGERSFYDRGSLHSKEYLDRMKKYNKIKAGTDLRDVLEKELSDWTGGVLKFKNHEIVQMPRDWYMKDNPNEKDDKSPVKAKLESVDYHTKVIVEKFKRGKGRLKFKKSPPIKVEGNAVSAAQRAAIAISKKEKAGKPGYDKEGKSMKKESIMDTYRQMWRDASDIVEVTDKEINAMKQLSKDAEKIKKGYQKIVNMGDKELKDRKYNKEYEDILKMQQSVLSLIGKLSNQKMINKESLEEKLSKADLKMIDMMYDKKGKLTDVGKAVMNYKPGDNIRKIVQNLNNKK